MSIKPFVCLKKENPEDYWGVATVLFSDSRSQRGIKDDIDTFVQLIFIFFSKLMILLAISDGFWLLLKSFVPVCKIAMSGFLVMVGLI